MRYETFFGIAVANLNCDSDGDSEVWVVQVMCEAEGVSVGNTDDDWEAIAKRGVVSFKESLRDQSSLRNLRYGGVAEGRWPGLGPRALFGRWAWRGVLIVDLGRGETEEEEHREKSRGMCL